MSAAATRSPRKSGPGQTKYADLSETCADPTDFVGDPGLLQSGRARLVEFGHTKHLSQLSLLPSAGREMNSSQRALVRACQISLHGPTDFVGDPTTRPGARFSKRLKKFLRKS